MYKNDHYSSTAYKMLVAIALFLRKLLPKRETNLPSADSKIFRTGQPFNRHPSNTHTQKKNYQNRFIP